MGLKEGYDLRIWTNTIPNSFCVRLGKMEFQLQQKSVIVDPLRIPEGFQQCRYTASKFSPKLDG